MGSHDSILLLCSFILLLFSLVLRYRVEPWENALQLMLCSHVIGRILYCRLDAVNRGFSSICGIQLIIGGSSWAPRGGFMGFLLLATSVIVAAVVGAYSAKGVATWSSWPALAVVPSGDASLASTVLFLYGTSEAGIVIGDCRLLAVSCVPLGIAVGVSTSVCLSATDVIHSLAVPSVGMKVDAVPGRLSRFGLTLLSIGSLCASCAEVCGAFHAFMPASLLVMLAWASHTPA